MRVLLAGLWARRGPNAAGLLVTLVAVAACVLGAMYARASAEHLLDTRIDQRAPYTTGLSNAVPALKGSDIPHGSATRYHPPVPAALVARAQAPFSDPADKEYWTRQRSWLLDRGGSLSYGGYQFEVPLYYRQGMCGLATVHGRCPSRPGEALVQATMAATLHVKVGGTVALRFSDSYLIHGKGMPSGREAQRHRTARYRVVGTYTVSDPASPAWFDLSRFTGIDNLRPAPSSPNAGSANPVASALLVAPSSMTSQSFEAGVDRPIDTSRVNLDTMGTVQRAARTFEARAIAATGQDGVDQLDLTSVFHEVRAERTLLSRVMIAALTPLVLLALLLLYALVSSAAQVRRPYVALAKLRGHSRRQVLGFALAEPFLVVAIAVPLGVTTAVAGLHLIAGTWLHPGIPLDFDAVTVVALVVVVGAALAASAVAAMAVIREPLSESLVGAVRPRRASRLAVVLRSAVVAVAVAAVAQLLTSGHQSAQLLALLAPSFIALAVAVAGVAVLRVLTGWWSRRTSARGGTVSFLATRRLTRRQDLVNLMIPLLLAVSVITFAASTSATSDEWRVSRARAEVGAARTFIAETDPGRLLQVTRDVDPEGRYVAAAVLSSSGDGMNRRLLVDTSRLASVAAWDPSWSDVPVKTLARRLRLDESKRISFTGKLLTVRLSGINLRSRGHDKPALQLQYVDDRGEQVDTEVGALHNGAAQTLSTRVEGCARTCLVEQLYVTGDSVSVTDVQGRLTVAAVQLDGRNADWRLDQPGAWRPARPFPVSLVDPPVLAHGGRSGLRLQLFLGKLPPGPGGTVLPVSGFARVTPSSTPDVEPVLVTTRTATSSARETGSGIALTYKPDVVAGVALNGESVPMHVVDRVHTLPLLGRQGSLADLETSLVEFEPPAGAVVTTELWAAADTPPSVLDAIRGQGIVLENQQRLGTVLHELRSDAFSIGLRVYLLVGLATLLLAVFGVFASAVMQARWRSYEVASLRVVGVSQRTLVRASVLEYVVMLGLAVVFGLLAAYLSLVLVLPSISLGAAEPFDPAPVYAVHWSLVAAVGVVLFVVATVIAMVVSWRVTRLGRPSTLRWAERG